MQVTPFRDYSNALVPLPSLNDAEAIRHAPSPSRPNSSFQNELRSRLGVDVTTGVTNEDRVYYPVPSNRSVTPAMSRITAEMSEEEQLMEICREIEGILLGIFLRTLGKELGSSGLFSSKWESSMYKDMFFYELAQSIGKTPPGLGIADMVYDDIMIKAGMLNELV